MRASTRAISLLQIKARKARIEDIGNYTVLGQPLQQAAVAVLLGNLKNRPGPSEAPTPSTAAYLSHGKAKFDICPAFLRPLLAVVLQESTHGAMLANHETAEATKGFH